MQWIRPTPSTLHHSAPNSPGNWNDRLNSVYKYRQCASRFSGEAQTSYEPWVWHLGADTAGVRPEVNWVWIRLDSALVLKEIH